MDEIRELAGMGYEEFKKKTIEEFESFLNETYDIRPEITEEQFDLFITSLHYEMMDDIESLEDKMHVEEVMKRILDEEYLNQIPLF